MKNLFTYLFLITLNFTFSQELKNYEFTGTIKTSNKSNFEISECISENVVLVGVKSKTKNEKDATASSFVNGEHSFGYYVDDYSKFAGNIEFKFEFIISNNEIKYKFYNFTHLKSNSSYKSLGILPKDWNINIKQFSQSQYEEIQNDIKLNMFNYLRLIQNKCIN